MVDLILGEDRVCGKDVSRQWGKRVESVRQEREWKRVPSILLLPASIRFALVAFIMAVLVLPTFILSIKVSNIAKMR